MLSGKNRFTCFKAGPITLGINLNLFHHPKAFSSFQFLTGTRSTFSFSFLSSPQLWSRVRACSSTLSLSSSLLSVLCAFLQANPFLDTPPVPLPLRLYSRSLPLGVLRQFHLPRRPFPSSPTFLILLLKT